MSDWKEIWYVWDGKDKPPKGVKKAICQCEVLIDDEKYFGSIDSAWDWHGVHPFIQAYTLGEKRRRVECGCCGGSGFNDDVFNEIGIESDCVVCGGTGKVWEYEK